MINIRLIRFAAEGRTIYIAGFYEMDRDPGGAVMKTITYYLLSDHLGSTSITTDSSGNLTSEIRYKPWGETRYNSGMTPTDYKYTGQREESDPSTGSGQGFGLYFYNARWYDPALGRFAQADSIVPPGAQGWDRYAATNNKLLNLVGHERLVNDRHTVNKPTHVAVFVGGSIVFLASDDRWWSGYNLGFFQPRANGGKPTFGMKANISEPNHRQCEEKLF